MLQSDFFDNETEAIIDLNVIYGAGKHITDKCLIIFSKEIHTYLLEHYECEIIGEIGACNGNIPIYCLEYKGEKIAFYLTGIGSAVASAMCYESHHVIGATKYIMFGSCGSLDKEVTKGKFIIPTESYRGEGCIAVEMELAGVQAICDFYGLELYDFLEAGDVLGDSEYEFEGLHDANHNIGKALIALEAATFL